MLPKTYRQLLAKQEQLKKKWLALNPSLNDRSGIYILTRHEDGINYAYIGQAKWILTRLASHLQGYEQHIDKSLRKHGLYSINNPMGWNVGFINCDENMLDQNEKFYIKAYAKGYQLLNKTTGGQGKGKTGMDYERQPKGYMQGLKQGREKAFKEIKVYFDKYLDFSIKDKPNKVKQRKYEEFERLLGGNYENREFKGNCIQDFGHGGISEE